MPGGNGTGPMGMGSMTGRAAGFCAGFEMPGYANAPARRGFGVGYGRGREFRGRNAGRGFRHMFKATGLPGWMSFGGYDAPYQGSDPDFEKQTLKNQINALQSELEFIKKRLSEIETASE
ncbi:MAG: hypothetical protein EHM85_15300 [Desulfobacteraceae bacterium]|nr:MAG: hypothetical protein EHM85_15300 [Desulfobacteraceae bacterium]